MPAIRLHPEQLQKPIPDSILNFNTTADLPPLDTIIGQQRALSALDIGMEIESSGYNVFATGFSGTGRTTIIKQVLEQVAASRPVPDDWCYVYNFQDPDSPVALNLPAGMGREFQDDMDQLISTLKRELKRAFSSDEYNEQRMVLLNRTNEQKRKLIEQLDEEARKLGIQIQSTPMGFQTIILKDGKPLPPEEYEKLSEEEKEQIRQKIQYIETRIAETVRALAKLDMEVNKSLNVLNERVASFVVEQYASELLEKYQRLPHVIRYLNAVTHDIINNIPEFLVEMEKEEQKVPQETERRSYFRRYKVNVIVDNRHLKGAPVIYETNPIYNNLIGRIEKYAIFGTYITDFTLIKAGSLLRANGGFLIVDALHLLRQPFVYDALKRAIKNREIRIEDVSELYGFLSPATIKPQPIPLKVKVVLIGNRLIYSLLRAYDEDFSKIFKIRADFDYETPASDSTLMHYAQFIKKVTEEEGLKAFDREAVKEVIKYGHRLVEDQEKISLQFGRIVNLIREAHYWAGKNGNGVITANDVKKAIQEYEFRHSLVKEKVQEMIERDIYRIEVDGEAVGQINGLAVLNMGDYTFGKPNRITAKTFIGNDSIVHIERKANLSGKIHDKGVYVFTGFFNAKFGTHMPLAFSASITFEQSYSLIDGDSASSTELFALISSLAGVPIKQGIAVTGSVNQNGEIQAIGGVNEKIEGFFQVCKAKGLTGEQGVIIPKANVKHLMLKDEVVEAVRQGQFHIWAIDTVEEGLEILTGMPAGERDKKGKFPRDTIYYRVEKRLVELARTAEKFRKKISGNNEKKNQSKKAEKSRQEKEEKTE